MEQHASFLYYLSLLTLVGFITIYFGYLRRRVAVVNVDVQNDFCPGGALAVPRGDEVVPVINKITQFVAQQLPYVGNHSSILSYLRAVWKWIICKWDIYFSCDEHPEITSHFKKYPKHCVVNTPGAQFHKDLLIPASAHIVAKGILPDKDDFSALSPDGRVKGTDYNLLTSLRKKRIGTLIVTGLAGNICVKLTVLDALKLGFKVYVVIDAIRSINFQPNDHEEALTEMVNAGAILITSDGLIAMMK